MRNFFLILFALALVMSCKNNEEQRLETDSSIDHQQAVHPENVGDLDDIELNNGELWKVEPEMSEGIQRISGIVENSDPQSADNYRDLGRRLEEERKNLEDKRDNQPYDTNLNIYFGPLEQKIKALQEVNSIEEGERLKAEIEKHLQAYTSYFE